MRYIDVCSGISAKTCTKCGAEKALEQFHRQPTGPHGRHSWCKACANAAQRGVRKRGIPADARTANNLWTRYRLRPEDVEQMLAEQDGLCAICGTLPNRAVVDHDHQTGAVRGVLCHGCNIKLNAVEDSAYLAAALKYLGRRA